MVRSIERVQDLKVKPGVGGHLYKPLFSLLLVSANRVIITVTSYYALGGRSLSGLFNLDVFKQVFYTSFMRYDTGWYSQIAQSGYTTEKSSAFFPLYPLIMRVSSDVTGLSYKVCGQAIAILCFIISLWLVQVLSEKNGILHFTSNNGQAGRWIACVVACHPASFFFSIAYTESLFFMLTLFFMISVAKRKWFMAGLAGFFAALTRNTGVFLVIIFVLEYFRSILPKWSGKKISDQIRHYYHSFIHFIKSLNWGYFRLYRSFFNILLIPAGVMGYFAFLANKFGSMMGPVTSQKFFGRSSMFPVITLYNGFIHSIDKLTTTDKPYIFHYYLLELFSVLIFLFALVYLIKHVPLSYNFFMLASLILPLCKPAYTGLVDYFVSFSRYTVTLYPYFVALYGIFHNSRKAFIFYLAASLYMLIMSVSFWCNGKFIA